jgi:MYXO-CTERM domain-containing protein
MPDAMSGLTTIGVSTGAAMRGLGPTDTDTFAGQTITGASVVAMYTYAGDANLDGVIDGGDYGVIDNNVQVSGASGYSNGDFNYDGVIDGGDYGIIDNNIQAQGARFATSAFTTPSGTSVPEPAACGLAFLAAAAFAAGRRRRPMSSRGSLSDRGTTESDTLLPPRSLGR